MKTFTVFCTHTICLEKRVGTPQSRIKGRRAPGNFYWRVHDVIVFKSYVFADSQGIRLFFPVFDNVLIQITQLAARREFMI